MRRHHKQALLICFAMSLMGMSGCEWENPLYDEFVMSDAGGRAVICEGLQYIMINGDACYEEDVETEERCSGYANSFKYGICPKHFSCSNDANGNNYCDDHSGCNESQKRCNGICIAFDSVHVASCDNDVIVCQEHYANCDGIPDNGCEVSLANDSQNCGKCGTECGTKQVCKEGNCIDNECDEGHHLNGTKCEPDTLSDCGRVGMDCTKLTGWSKGVCEKGQCIYQECLDNYHLDETGINCIADTNGCCGVKCETCNTGQVCNKGECSDNCGGDDDSVNDILNCNGTCVNITTDLNNCGNCNIKCDLESIDNSHLVTCYTGNCIAILCDDNYHLNPDYQSIDEQCEQDDVENCGAHEFSCAEKVPGWIDGECTAGACVPTVCATGYEIKNGRCELIECSGEQTLCFVNSTSKYECKTLNGTDANHCGTCNYACDEHILPNTSPSGCFNGECLYICTNKYVNVGDDFTGDTINCIDPKTDIAYCGATAISKGESCPDNQVCVNGECVFNSCPGSYTLCSTTSGNQCINVKSNDPNNCGTCNYKCSEHNIPNASSNTCKQGECQYTCNSGYVNVGTGITDKTINCIDPDTNIEHCGAKTGTQGESCGAGKVCVKGKCVINSCSTGTLCYTNDTNKCIDIKSNNTEHCGACNYDCREHVPVNAEYVQCSSGKCQFKCKTGFYNVGSGITHETIHCINPDNDTTYCGANDSDKDGTTCPSGQVCVNRECVVNSCSMGTLCYVDNTNQCIVLNDNKMDHCGACNYACEDNLPNHAEAIRCDGKVCKYQCKETDGYYNCGSGDELNTTLCLSKEEMQGNNHHCGKCKNDCTTQNQVCSGGQCVDPFECCGNSCTNCRSTKFAASGTCNAGKCKIDTCIDGYHWDVSSETCVKNTNDSCAGTSVEGVTVISCTANAQNGFCKVDGKCYASGCNTNYHLYTVNENTVCEEDTISNCGEHGVICKIENGTASCPNGTCTPSKCNAGFYKEGDSCKSCPNGYTSIEGGTCKACPAGQTSNEAHTSCGPCPDGQYSATAGGTCTACPAHSTTTDHVTCVCGEGYYMEGNECKQCEAGKEPNPEHTSCVPCGDGEFSEAGGTCGTCDGNQFTTDHINCQTCPENSTTTDHVNCICNAGYTKDENSCTQCGDGEISEAGGTCRTCDGNQFTTDHINCQTCPENSTTTDHVNCICNAGYEKSGDSCKSCDDGYISATAGSACTACPAGQTSNDGNTACEPCPDGFISASDGGRCTACSTGETSNPSHTQCVCDTANHFEASEDGCECAAGYTLSDSESECVKNDPGE